MPVTHTKVSGLPDGPDDTLIRPSDWDAEHEVSVATAEIANDAVTYAKIQNVSATDKGLGRVSAGAGDVEEFAVTAAARSFLDDIDAQAQRNTLVLGEADTVTFAKQRLTPAADAQDTFRVTNAAAGYALQLGTYPGAPSYGGFWAGNIVPSTFNYTFIGNGTSETIFNVPTGGTIYFRVNQSAAPNMIKATAAGVGILQNTIAGNLHVSSTVASSIKSIFQGTASQTGDLTQWQNSAGAVLASVNSGGSLQLAEMTAPSAPAANNVRLYAEDNGSGKTRLMALFPTGGAVQIAIEP